MKTALVLATTLALAAAAPQPQHQHGLPPGTKINCLKANKSYCWSTTAILHCDDRATGEPAYCNDDGSVSSVEPADGGSLCSESFDGAGDAVCEVKKN